MSDLKNILAAIAVILVFIGYVPYVRDIIKGKTKPHIFSWIVWSFLTFIALGLQISGGAGSGALVTLTVAVIGTSVALLALLTKGKKDIVKSDFFFLTLAFISLYLWVIVKQPILSAILSSITELLGFAPTIRKSWKDPHSETLSFYLLNTFRFLLAILAIQNYSIVTVLYPLTWLIANGLFGLMLIVRRKQIG